MRVCEPCGEPMKLIAFILDATTIHRILSCIGEEIEPPQMQPARAPPNEFYGDASQVGEYQYDQTLSW